MCVVWLMYRREVVWLEEYVSKVACFVGVFVARVLHGLQIDAIFLVSHKVKDSCEDSGLVSVSGNAFGQRLNGGYAVR